MKLFLALAIIVCLVAPSAVAPPPEYYDIAPAPSGNGGVVVEPQPVQQSSENLMDEGLINSGMSAVLMLLGLLLLVSVGSAVIIYRLKVRS